MKTTRTGLKASLLIVGIGLVLNGYSQSILTNGLLAYFPFNGNAFDASGNGYDGNVQGAILTTDRFGNTNAAYHFTGGQYIDVPLDCSSKKPLTYSLWFIQDTPAQFPAQALIWTGTFDAAGQDLGIRNPTNDFWVSYQPNNGYITGFLVKQHVWTHVTVTYSDKVVLYVNGRKVVEIPYPSQPISRSSITRIGRDQDFYNYSFEGAIDDVRIYNRALSAPEVQQLYAYESQTHWDGAFEIVAGGFSWFEAKADAELRGGHLATFGTQAKWDALVNEFKVNSEIIVDAWAGGYQPAGSPEPAGNWTWVTGEPWTFSAWYPGEPNNQNPDDYLHIAWGTTVGWSNAKWNDAPNFSPFSYILELGPRVDLIKAVKPSFSNLSPGTIYQMQISGDLNTWTNHGAAFSATNTSMVYPEYFDVENWGSLYLPITGIAVTEEVQSWPMELRLTQKTIRMKP